MKIRNLLLIICAWCCMPAMAQVISHQSFRNGSITPQLHAAKNVNSSKEVYKTPISSTVSDLYSRVQAETYAETKPWLTWEELKIKTQAANPDQLQLDSIIGTEPNGSNYTRQYFIYDEEGRLIKRMNSYWNASTHSWETVEEYNYEWDKDGYVLMQSLESYGQGQRIEYVYNDRKLGIEQVISFLDGNNNWIKSEKGEYQYDDRGNMTDEMIYLWTGNEWYNVTHSTATYDDQNRQTSILMLSWDGAGWNGELKEDYAWHSADKLSYKGMYRWIPETKEWLLVDVFEQEFNQAGQLTVQKRKFWNEDRQNWTGEYNSWGTSEICITYKAKITYDERGRTTLQQHNECYNNGAEWFTISEMITKWTDGLADGAYESEMNAYLYDYNTKKKTWNQREYGRYDAQGRLIWFLNQMQNMAATEMNDNYEEKYEYDAKGNLIYSAVWDWIDGVRTPNIEERNTYDADNNIIESFYREAEGGGSIPFGAPQMAPGHEPQDDEGWKNTSHFTYKYENGCRIEKLAWRWNESDWSTNFGEATKYDWSIPATELITPLGWADPYKIDFTYNYTGDGNGGWFINTNTYFYAVRPTGIYNTPSGNLSFSNNILKTTGGNQIENRIYDVTGKLVYQGNHPEEDLNHLNKGIYVVRSLINNQTFTLKIIIQ